MSITAAVVVVTVIGLLGSAVLVVASQFLRVEVDERVELVLEVLPGINCGACGYAGCADYAQAVVDGEKPNLCVPGGAQTAEEAALIMGADAGAVKVQRAVVACQGTAERVSQKYSYTGIETCAAASGLHGGASSCPYGCLGYGDCTIACPYDAIELKDGIAHVNQKKCTGCGACVAACPKRIIWIRDMSENDKPVVMCANHQKGADTRKECTVGCIACMRCQKICPSDAIHVINNVARIDLEKCINCGRCVEVCPAGTILAGKDI